MTKLKQIHIWTSVNVNLQFNFLLRNSFTVQNIVITSDSIVDLNKLMAIKSVVLPGSVVPPLDHCKVETWFKKK